MNKEALIEALKKVDFEHDYTDYTAKCICGEGFNSGKESSNKRYFRAHLYLMQIEALIPLIGQGIAENIINCCVYCVNGDHEEDCETYFAAQIARNWKAVRGERGRNV